MNAVAGPVEQLLEQATRMMTPFDPADGAGHLVWHAWGDGDPVVLLHGGAGSWRHWVRNIPALVQDGRRVLAPDLPGLGESSPPPEPYDPVRVAGILAAGLRQVLPPGVACDLVGFSFGAVAAGHVAALHPAYVRTLTLVGAGALGVVRAPIELVPVRDKEGAAREDANRTNLLRLMIADPARVDALALAVQDWNARRARVNSVGFAESTLLLDRLRAVTCPIGAIWGEADQVARPLLQDRIAVLRSVRPDMPVETVPAAGHWVAFEAADLFDRALGRILDRLAAQRRG
jgi:pimeloyl-ACP methyl ester carboxylesterase